MPSLKEEKRLWKKGYQNIVCLDEAGRGALAGPVVAAAVVIKNSKFKSPPLTNLYNESDITSFQRRSRLRLLKEVLPRMLPRLVRGGFRASNLKLRDSKKLSPKQREKIYKLIISSPQIEWGIGRVSEKVIDKINILEATKLAMKRALINLERKHSHGRIRIPRGRAKRGRGLRYWHADFLILDGNFKIDLPIPQKSITKADEKVFSCALASILAKVTRDRIMLRYHKKYPQYGFAKHKGYPTKFHLKMLRKYGPSKIHRKSFKPVSPVRKKRAF